jgi:hypothetical protein
LQSRIGRDHDPLYIVDFGRHATERIASAVGSGRRFS